MKNEIYKEKKMLFIFPRIVYEFRNSFTIELPYHIY